MIVWSWGFNSPVALLDGLQFKVQEFIFQGVIRIKHNEGKDLFYINFLKNNVLIDTILDVYVEDLIQHIDNYVEKVENYNERVKKEYLFLTK